MAASRQNRPIKASMSLSNDRDLIKLEETANLQENSKPTSEKMVRFNLEDTDDNDEQHSIDCFGD